MSNKDVDEAFAELERLEAEHKRISNFKKDWDEWIKTRESDGKV